MGKLELIKFYSKSCGPCQMMSTYMEGKNFKPTEEYNVEEPDGMVKAGEYGIMKVPVLILLEDGKEIQRELGFSRFVVDDLIKRLG